MDLAEVAELVGEYPAWVELGPEQDYRGYVVQEVLGGWPDDMVDPPRFICAKPGVVAQSRIQAAQDPDRIKVPQRYPGMDISGLKGKHRGAVAILFNGGSLAQHDLSKIKVPIIGMNRTYVGYPGYTGPQPDYYCAIDQLWFFDKYVLDHPGLINGGIYDPTGKGYRVTRSFRAAPFSFDLSLDGYPPSVPCTTGFLALQVAVYMGFTELFCLGLDYGGAHFDGTKSSKFMRMASNTTRRMAKAIDERGGIKVWICGSPNSACDAFPHAPFSQLLEAVGE